MLKFAVIGLGVMGKNHARALQNVADAKLVAACDPFTGGDFCCKHYGDLDKMLESEDLDAAVIATPTFAHKDAAIKCAQKGVNLLIEKPLASSAPQAREIAEAAKKLGIKAAVGHVERFNPAVCALKNELVQRRIYEIHTTRISPFPTRIGDVGVLADLAVHDIDLIRFISGEEILSSHILKSRRIHASCEDSANLSFELSGGATACARVSWLSPFKKRTIEVVCEGGVFEADLISQELKFYANLDANSFSQKSCFVKKSEALSGELNAFTSLLKGQNSDIATLEDGIRTLEVIL